jgi:hypothetical protein
VTSYADGRANTCLTPKRDEAVPQGAGARHCTVRRGTGLADWRGEGVDTSPLPADLRGTRFFLTNLTLQNGLPCEVALLIRRRCCHRFAAPGAAWKGAEAAPAFRIRLPLGPSGLPAQVHIAAGPGTLWAALDATDRTSLRPPGEDFVSKLHCPHGPTMPLSYPAARPQPDALRASGLSTARTG